jgi:hypothetical protein
MDSNFTADWRLPLPTLSSFALAFASAYFLFAFSLWIAILLPTAACRYRLLSSFALAFASAYFLFAFSLWIAILLPTAACRYRLILPSPSVYG